MVFSSSVFLFAFLPIVLAGYFALSSLTWRNCLLLAASLFFYAWGEGFYLLILMASIVANTVCGRWIAGHTGARRQFALSVGVAINLVLLGTFKYSNFIVDNINHALGLFTDQAVLLAPVHLPLGISFFTFQAISYLVDIYRKSAPAQRGIVNVALYISLFPQLIAGPIVRYSAIQSALTDRRVEWEGFAYGTRRFIIGLGKKMLLANTLGETADTIFASDSGDIGGAVAWLGIVCYTLQIYYDFSGYSDMAIGLGHMFGFKFAENFRHPYISRSIREFWRRWHISLSSWFRDYLYIPLGGNRHGAWRTRVNLITVFLLCGLWHGASWTFIVWGVYHGVFLALERGRFGQVMNRMPVALQHLYLVLIVMIGWVFFRSENIGAAFDYLMIMAGTSTAVGLQADIDTYLTRKLTLALAFGVIFAAPWITWLRPLGAYTLTRISADTLLIGVLLLCAMSLAAGTYNPFIYFRF